MRKPKWRNITIAAVVVGLLAYLIVMIVKFSQNKPLLCNGVEIVVKDSADIQFISSNDVRMILKHNHIKLTGKMQNDIDLDKLERKIDKDPVIRKVDCFYLRSGKIGINVWQRVPLFRVMTDEENYYVDADGHSFPVSMHYVAYVPIVTGKVTEKFATTALRSFVGYIHNDEFWNAQVEQIDVEDNNRIVMIPRLGDHEIIIGQLFGYPQKLEKLKIFYKEGLCKIGWGDYKSVNAEFKGQVVCTKKDNK